MDVLDRLERFYGPLPQPPSDPFAVYVWEVLGVQTTPMRRDAAMNALRRIPALTPDSMARAARAKLEGAVALAGPYREERLRALLAGVDVFKRNRDLPDRIRRSRAAAAAAIPLLPHLTAVSGQRLLLYAGGHAVLPADPHAHRVLSRVGRPPDVVTGELGGVVSAVQRAAQYLEHHGRATCLEAAPLCHICPLQAGCPYYREAQESRGPGPAR